MPHPDLAVVTGAFSYTGRYVTRRLLDQGVRVRTLTRSPDAEDPFGGRVKVAPWTSRTPMDCAVRCRERASSTTPTGYGTRTEGQPSTSPWRTPGRCSRQPRARASAG